MATRFGDRRRFAVEIGESWRGSEGLRRVDLWAAGRWLTRDDNRAFVPQFCMSVQGTIDRLRSGGDLSPPFPDLPLPENHRRLLAADDGSHEPFRFPQWGPTTDNLLGLLFRRGDQLMFTFEFWRDTHPIPEDRSIVFVAELPEAEFLGVLGRALAALREGGRPSLGAAAGPA